MNSLAQGKENPPAAKPLGEMEVAVSRILRIGVLTSTVVIAFGLLLLFLRDGLAVAHVSQVLHAPPTAPAYPVSPGELLRESVRGNPAAIIALGLVLLIATPVLRVAASVFLFLREGDRLYAGITLFVLVVLLLSFVLGEAGV
ncbi:putative membrane protein [Brockia lithotrophica]|uniref:Putative membrane protein n=1 Tax=Brockia lithotrophica TaxID=933949 RepID=A0A660L3Q5_9BACL|nr:putative membrane protein [Brockia lithotrophica]